MRIIRGLCFRPPESVAGRSNNVLACKLRISKKGAPRSLRNGFFGSDTQHVFNVLSASNTAGCQEYLAYCQARCKAMFDDRFTWAGVEALRLNALMRQKTLRYQDAKKIFFDASANIQPPQKKQEAKS